MSPLDQMIAGPIGQIGFLLVTFAFLNVLSQAPRLPLSAFGARGLRPSSDRQEGERDEQKADLPDGDDSEYGFHARDG